MLLSYSRLQISAKSLVKLDAALTLEELEKALQDMKSKALGLDGIPAEFSTKV